MQNSSMLCVDASLVIRRVLDPPSSPARRVWAAWDIDGRSFTAPHLMPCEVTNGLYKYQRARLLSEEAVRLALAAAIALPVVLTSSPTLHTDAHAKATEFNLRATYDAHYLALAQHLGLELWTADERLYNAVHHKLEWVHVVK